jgi:hypothetical protein
VQSPQLVVAQNVSGREKQPSHSAYRHPPPNFGMEIYATIDMSPILCVYKEISQPGVDVVYSNNSTTRLEPRRVPSQIDAAPVVEI